MKDKDKYFGRDEYNNSVVVKCDHDLKGKIKLIKINHYNQNTLFGELVYQEEQKEDAA